MAQIARALREARESSRDNTQERMARRTGVSRYTLSRLEAGSTWADLENVLRVASELKLDLNFTRRGSGEAEASSAAD